MIITFNTGRLYSREGQIISARYDAETEKVSFNDHSRMITGTFDLASTTCFPMTPTFLAIRVMREYDNGRYENRWLPEAPKRQGEVHQFRI